MNISCKNSTKLHQGTWNYFATIATILDKPEMMQLILVILAMLGVSVDTYRDVYKSKHERMDKLRRKLGHKRKRRYYKWKGSPKRHRRWSSSSSFKSDRPTRLVINAKGTSVGDRIIFPGMDFELLCFSIPLYRLEKNRGIGIGNSCIAADTSSEIINITSDTMEFRLSEGNFTSTTKPLFLPTGQETYGFVVSTEFKQFSNNVVNGEGIFNGSSGDVRLSGFFEGNWRNSSRFMFDFIYVIDFHVAYSPEQRHRSKSMEMK